MKLLPEARYKSAFQRPTLILDTAAIPRVTKTHTTVAIRIMAEVTAQDTVLGMDRVTDQVMDTTPGTVVVMARVMATAPVTDQVMDMTPVTAVVTARATAPVMDTVTARDQATARTLTTVTPLTDQSGTTRLRFRILTPTPDTDLTLGTRAILILRTDRVTPDTELILTTVTATPDQVIPVMDRVTPAQVIPVTVPDIPAQVTPVTVPDIPAQVTPAMDQVTPVMAPAIPARVTPIIATAPVTDQATAILGIPADTILTHGDITDRDTTADTAADMAAGTIRIPDTLSPIPADTVTRPPSRS
jgi:hypothetical protein